MMTRLIAAALLTGLTALAAVNAKTIYFVGNSVTDGIDYGGLKQLAESRGYTHVFGRDMIPGAPLWIHLQDPDVGIVEYPYGQYPEAFAGYTWDAVSLQTFDCALNGNENGDSVSVGRFIQLLRQNQNNRATAIYLMGHHPRTDWSGTSAQAWDTYWNKDSKDPATFGWVESCIECADYYRELTLAVRKANPGVSVQLIPTGHVFAKLNQRIRSGQLTGYSSIVELAYMDGIHTNEAGAYINGLTYLAVLYGIDPRGVGTAGYSGVPAALAGQIQSAVYEVINDASLTPLINAGPTPVENRVRPMRPGREGEVAGPAVSLRGERLTTGSQSGCGVVVVRCADGTARMRTHAGR